MNASADTVWHFPVFIATSFVAFIAVLRFAMRRRAAPPSIASVLWVAVVVVIGGMVFAKVGATSGWPVWLYYGVPASLTWLLPPLVFRMRGGELAAYLLLALLVAPVIHVLFSFLLGWHEYMPFIRVPWIGELNAMPLPSASGA